MTIFLFLVKLLNKVVFFIHFYIETRYPIKRCSKNVLLKGTVSVILSDTPCQRPMSDLQQYLLKLCLFIEYRDLCVKIYRKPLGFLYNLVYAMYYIVWSHPSWCVTCIPSHYRMYYSKAGSKQSKENIYFLPFLESKY